MAPRTKDQQEAYNAKRRAETAAKKTVKSIPEHRIEDARTNMIQPEPKKVRVVKSAAKPKNTSKAKAKRMDKVKAEPAHVRDLGPGKGVLVVPAKPLHKKQGKEFDAAFYGKHGMSPKDALDRAKPAPAPQTARIPNSTMKLSYLRNGAPGAGMQRGKNFQATVTFTPAQFLELRDKASFNNRSLAEQIRWSVIQQLKTA